MGDIYPLPDMFNVDDDEARRMARPSARRDFVPTVRGWVAILVATLAVAWLVRTLGGHDAGLAWLVAGLVIGYAVAVVAWAIIRRALDARDDARTA